jgi:hypothetical protein
VGRARFKSPLAHVLPDGRLRRRRDHHSQEPGLVWRARAAPAGIFRRSSQGSYEVMDRRWLSIRVDLIGGRGQILDPRPGRTFAVPPNCTFDELGEAIDLAFARWDLSHLRQFALEDGTLVVDEETADELSASAFGGGTIHRSVLLNAKVGQHLKVGSGFRYVFDLGDDWTHTCAVEGHIDPLEVLGDVPDQPTAYWGWGSIPDQYGRR